MLTVWTGAGLPEPKGLQSSGSGVEEGESSSAVQAKGKSGAAKMHPCGPTWGRYYWCAVASLTAGFKKRTTGGE